MKIKVVLIALALNVSYFSQSRNPDLILENVRKEFERIEDYQVDVQVKVDVSFLKMPDREARVYFKKPDKIHIDSENFAMLPKSGLNFSPLEFLNYKYTAFYEREDTINGIATSVIKVIPLEGKADVILSTLWIDTKRNIILKVESSRKPQGSFTVNLDYSKISNEYWLPNKIVFEFTFDGMVLPKRFGDNQDIKSNKKKSESQEPATGKVYLTYNNYKVNIGLSDEFFEKNVEIK